MIERFSNSCRKCTSLESWENGGVNTGHTNSKTFSYLVAILAITMVKVFLKLFMVFSRYPMTDWHDNFCRNVKVMKKYFFFQIRGSNSSFDYEVIGVHSQNFLKSKKELESLIWKKKYFFISLTFRQKFFVGTPMNWYVYAKKFATLTIDKKCFLTIRNVAHNIVRWNSKH